MQSNTIIDNINTYEQNITGKLFQLNIKLSVPVIVITGNEGFRSQD